MQNFHERELFDSPWKDEIPMESINSKITILSEAEFFEAAVDDDTYFIKRFYDPVVNKIRKKDWKIENEKPGATFIPKRSSQKAIQKLQLAAIPDSLPCREGEREKIYSFLHDAISRGKQVRKGFRSIVLT